ncbi:MAG: asparaginase [Rhodocyclaceae bacterium]|nr:asparaginase [Rhodocyclaceae bacterium]
MSATPLIALSRGGVLESEHFGAVAVVDCNGKLLTAVGDAHRLTFSRSTLKAFQALPLLEGGGHVTFGYDSKHLALLCASHNGETMHIDVVDEMLAKLNLPHTTLECGCHVPAQYSYFDESPPAGTKWDQRHNNCSGKHAGFLAYCVQHGTPTANYVSPMHPLQLAIRRDVAKVVDMDENALCMGIDGCSSPNYAMPLSKIAYAYARLAAGIHDTKFGASFALLGNAMTTHPELVSGTHRNDLAFMQTGRGDWISKVGADGVQAIASKSRREAFAVKIADGNRTALFATAVEVLEQLGWLDNAQREQLAPWRATDITNARGIVVGQRRPVFSLQTFS